MNRHLKKELKRLLSGRTILDNEGVLVALPEGQRMIFHGLTNGWSSVLFSGIAVQEYCFQLASDGAEAFSVVFPVMQRLGRLVVLSERETALACMRRYPLSRPVILAADHEGDGLVRLSLYTAKGLPARYLLRRGLNDFCRALPEGLANPVAVAVKKHNGPHEEKTPRMTRKERRVEKALQALQAEKEKEARRTKGKREM
ncbi:MAG: hypothetical protein IKV99_07150 [Oscillospiraceae bacterium]|nr:hypothetical protein [Oscillospiraceae bacterium]